MGCAAAIVDVSYESSYGPTLITNNDGGTEVSMPSKSGGTFSPLAAHNTSLAAFLMGMNEGSYFGTPAGCSEDHPKPSLRSRRGPALPS